MTIIKNTYSIRHHPLTAIDENVADLVIKGAAEHQLASGVANYAIRPPLQILEAYCDITGQRISMATLKSPAIEKILRGFTAAMAGKEFVELKGDLSKVYCRHLFQALTMAQTHLPGAHSVAWESLMFAPSATECTRMAAASDFHRWYWKGWTIQWQRHPGIHLRLAQLVKPYGQDFVEKIYRALEMHYRNRARAFRAEWNYMFDYLSANDTAWPKSTFSTEAGVKHFMHAFTLSYFTRSKEMEKDAKSQIKNWNKFLNAVEGCLCIGEIWAKLGSSIRRPLPSTKHGSETKVHKREDGILVQEKLLTSIPLHVTDSEAIDLLFSHQE
ncbi:hypothetical protein [Pseudomonas sp. TH31]|uniref:hypothetical protein n=1 Tax=Pseudomonas sp. TH31 TaxID=2796396 RepID=UPI001F5BF6EC|nr:hypothetical protein [Pseudomonas sp. TH31]